MNFQYLTVKVKTNLPLWNKIWVYEGALKLNVVGVNPYPKLVWYKESLNIITNVISPSLQGEKLIQT